MQREVNYGIRFPTAIYREFITEGYAAHLGVNAAVVYLALISYEGKEELTTIKLSDSVGLRPGEVTIALKKLRQYNIISGSNGACVLVSFEDWKELQHA